MNKWLLVGTVTLAGWWYSVPVHAQEMPSNAVQIEVLERADCAHCQEEKAYLEQFQRTRSDIPLRFYDIDTPGGKKLFDEVTAKAGLPKATPITVVGTSVFQGFDSDAVTGKRIDLLIEQNRGATGQGFENFLKSDTATASLEGQSCNADSGTCTLAKEPLFVQIPLTKNVIDISTWTLPALAATIGFFDGFNPCAMWVLVTFLIILMQLGSKRQMWIVVGSFLVAEAVMYYLILNVWLKVWDFIGMDRVITPMVGAISIGGGLFFLYEWYKSLGTEMACRVVDMEDRSRIVRKIRELATNKFTLLTLAGIVVLAFSVNIIEFACSIGYPQAFTKIIQVNNLGFWHTQYLMAIYIFFYMVDDLVVFGLAVWGFDKIHMTEAFSRWSALLGGILMLFLGWMLIFHPEILRSFS